MQPDPQTTPPITVKEILEWLNASAGSQSDPWDDAVLYRIKTIINTLEGGIFVFEGEQYTLSKILEENS